MASDGGNERPLAGLLAVGMVLVASLLVGYFIGNWLDGKLGTGPWLMVSGVFLGTAAGFVQLFRTVSRGQK